MVKEKNEAHYGIKAGINFAELWGEWYINSFSDEAEQVVMRNQPLRYASLYM